MIQLCVLGSIELRADDGTEIRDALVQPKRLALLVYLAAASPGAFHRRDSLIALFWPELDESHARDALKQAISYLRRALAPGAESVIQSRGTDELSLSTQAVWTDVRAFEGAIEDRRYDEALQLYRGDLLEGFFSGGSNEFEDWLSRARTRLRALAADAAQGLAEQRERDGDMAGAVNAARHAVALAELAEPVFRTLLTLLDRAGDRVGAIRAYDAFEARLAAEYDTEPAAETRELMEVIRARQTRHALSPQRASGGEYDARSAPQLPATHLAEALSTPRPEVALPGVHRAALWPRILTGAIAAMVLTAGTMFMFRRREDTGLNPKRVVVAPFTNLTGDSTLDVLGLLIADGVTRGLEQLDSVQIVSSQVAFRHVREKAQKLTDVGGLPSIGEKARAGRVVEGSYSRRGDTLRLEARIVSTRDGRVETALEPVAGSVLAPYAAIERVREGVATALQATQAKTIIGSIGRLPTLVAYREFLDALALGVESREAEPHLVRATGLDTTFTLAQYWLAVNYAGWERWKAADSVLQVLSVRRDGFSPVERELFAEADAYVHHDWQRDLSASRRLLERDSTYANAGGVALIALLANRPREALETLQPIPLSRVPARNWGHWNKMALAQHMLGDHEAELAVATFGRTLLPQPYAQVLMLEKQTRALAALGRLSALRLKVDSAVAAWNSSVISDRSPTFLNVFTNPPQTYERVALELFAHGHPGEALVYVRQGLEWHTKKPSDADTSAADSLQFSLARLFMLAGTLDSARTIWTRLAPRDTLYTGARIQLAIVSARLRDTVSALRTMHTLDSLAGLQYAFGLPRVGEARIAVALGRKDQAVRFLRRAMQEGVAFGTDWHSDADFQSLQNYESFKSLLRPAGTVRPFWRFWRF